VPTSRAAGHLGGEGVELIHHGVDGVLQFRISRASTVIFREITRATANGDLGDVPHLGGEVSGRGHVVGQVFHVPAAPGTLADLPDDLGADVPRHPGHLAGEGAELPTMVFSVSLSAGLAADVDGDLAGEISAGVGATRRCSAPGR
jgi:hypothetical protein